jgi:hypothetical protein
VAVEGRSITLSEAWVWAVLAGVIEPVSRVDADTTSAWHGNEAACPEC